MDQIFTLNYGEVFGRIADIVRDPASNPQLAWLLLAVVTLFVLILLAVAVMFIVTRTDEEEEEYVEGEEWETGPLAQAGEAYAPARPPLRPTILGTAVVFALIAAAWVAMGVVTAQTSICLSCHAGSLHAKAKGTDPHGTVSCVECHERGGVVGSATFMVAPRAIHFVSGIISTNVTDDYTRGAPSSSCMRCHASAIAKTVTIPSQGVRVSHKEPLAAGAECTDCHALAEGVVSARTVGMTPCLRCHDGKTAPSGCKSCHTKDIGAAVRPSIETTIGPQDLIGTPNCYSCHSPVSCDNCHGYRMPHTREFMLHGHARAAAEDFWFNGGKTCIKCHNAQRRSCQRCHGQMPSHGATNWALGHQYGNPIACSQGCHGTKASLTRPICAFCHDGDIKPRRAPVATTTPTL
jgi:hypothetical protein